MFFGAPMNVWRLSSRVLLAIMLLGGCSRDPLSPYTTESPPLVLVPVNQAGVRDMRGEFREIFCRVLEARGHALPDYRPCEEALTRVGGERDGTGVTVDLGPAKRRLVVAFVPGLGTDCLDDWVKFTNATSEHLHSIGFDFIAISVEGLSSSANNARQIRDAIMEIDLAGEDPQLVLSGYSKGAVDILEAIVTYPEIRPKILAVVSTSGAIGGSPLANAADSSRLNMVGKLPGVHCSPGDGGAIESLRPEIRKAWLAENPLPTEIRYYSLVTLPEPDRISAALKPAYNLLSEVDTRNDSQLLFYDQVIPGSTLLAYINADHWAAVLPMARHSPLIAATFLDHNAYPREALLEATLRFIEWDLDDTGR